MNILIMDTETTGLDFDKDRVIEVAAIVYSIDHATVLESYSSLIGGEELNAAEHINRIPASALAFGANAAEEVWQIINKMTAGAKFIVAHNADFDRRWCQKYTSGQTWICSKYDIQWPKQTRPAPSLVALALEHDLGVAYAHRAMADCDLIARLFTRSRELGCDLWEMIAKASRPKARVIAHVSYDDRELAKRAGFQWDGSVKQWSRVMFADDVSTLPFRYTAEQVPA